jgi:hypothetical protein
MPQKQKIAFIIPGGNHDCGMIAYKKIGGYFKKKGIKPLFIEINWKQNSIQDLISESRKKISDYLKIYQNSEKYMLGFSFGAMCCIANSIIVKPKKLILCSLSAFYREDIPRLSWWMKLYADYFEYPGFKKPSYPAITRDIEKNTLFIYGQGEILIFNKKNVEARKKIFSQSEVKIVKGAWHNIGNRNYQRTIEGTIKDL